jgi:hypothetical protein
MCYTEVATIGQIDGGPAVGVIKDLPIRAELVVLATRRDR